MRWSEKLDWGESTSIENLGKKGFLFWRRGRFTCITAMNRQSQNAMSIRGNKPRKSRSKEKNRTG